MNDSRRSATITITITITIDGASALRGPVPQAARKGPS